jgi:hypothetical protein
MLYLCCTVIVPQVYYVYGFFLLVFLILLIVTVRRVGRCLTLLLGPCLSSQLFD